MIGQMVTEIASEAKAVHFAGLVPVILPLLDGRFFSEKPGDWGGERKGHPVVNWASAACMHAKCMQVHGNVEGR